MPVLESIGLAALGWVASPIVTKLLNEGFASLGIDMEERAEKAEATILPVFKAVIEKAEGSEHRSKVEKWLQRLKDAYDDAEDGLDLLDYGRLEGEAKAAARRAGNGRRIRVPSLFRSHPVLRSVGRGMSVLKSGRDVLSSQKMELRRRLNKLEKIAGEAEKLRALLDVQPDTAPPPDRQTISQPPQKVFGREKDCEKIMQLLKMEPAAIPEPGSAGVPIIAVVGRPGVGKTTLAQYIFKRLRDEGGKHFDLVVWVYASCNFKVSEIMKSIIQQASIAGEPPRDPADPEDPLAMIRSHLRIAETTAVSSTDSLQVLQQTMDVKLKSKKFLLVIDDVWCDGDDHRTNWDTLQRCLGKCLPGSKILVTSQKSDAPRKIGAATENIYQLEELGEEDFMDLFIHHALPSRKANSRLPGELETTGEAIARKLNKDPTAAKMVGLCLRDKLEVRYWRETAEKDYFDDKTKALMWSYQHLPAHLQRCFSYFSLYPEGHKFNDLEVVQFWMAHGFIRPAKQNERMEDVGREYLNELVCRFYIQHRGSYYTLHELLYDLARRVSSNDCLRVEGDRREKIPSAIRHLCIPADKLYENKEDICKLKRLRTLIVAEGEGSGTTEENVIADIFKSLTKLRVLLLELNLEDLPGCIGEMKHLRVLQVSGSSEFVLPESVRTLYQLQVLTIQSAGSLPQCLNNLVSLRYLEADSDLVSKIPDIGGLTLLQGLEKFQVRKETGYELEQLQNLNELRGSLCIRNLENVESKESAIAANLKEKRYLEKLQLVWCDGGNNVNSNLGDEILEGLRVPPKLTSLLIDGYPGRSCPSWPECQTSTIEKLKLRECRMLEELPPMDRLYPCCRSLKLSHLSRLEALHTLPPSLTEVKIENTPFLTFVTKEDRQMSEGEKRSVIEVMRKRTREWFPRLFRESLVDSEGEMRDFIAAMNGSNNDASSPEHTSELAGMDFTAVWERWLQLHERKMELIYNRRNEAKLLLPSTLTVLQLEQCNITNHALSVCLQTLTSLTILMLADIKTITRLPSVEVLRESKALQDVSLCKCWALTSLGGIGSLPHVEKLHLRECPCLDGETAFLPSSLKSITFVSCADVDKILGNANLPHLSDLTITNCDIQTAYLPLGNLQSLRFLEICNCPNLQTVMNLPRSLIRYKIFASPYLDEQFGYYRPYYLSDFADDNPNACSVM